MATVPAGSFYRLPKQNAYILFVGHLRHKPDTMFTIVATAPDTDEKEYNTGVFEPGAAQLSMSKGGRKYSARVAKRTIMLREVYQVHIAECYRLLDHDRVLHIDDNSEARRVYSGDDEYAEVYKLYKRTLNEFTQSSQFDQETVTGSQLQASMSWVIACPPPLPAAQRTRGFGGAVPGPASYSGDPHSGSTVWKASETSTNMFSVLTYDSEDNSDDDDRN